MSEIDNFLSTDDCLQAYTCLIIRTDREQWPLISRYGQKQCC